MNRITKLLLIFIIALFVVSCTKPQATSSNRFIGGDKGLEISFIKDEPPEIVSDNNQDEFDIGIALKNVGEEDIESGNIIITLNGIEKDAFSLSSLSAKNLDVMAGKHKLTQGNRVIPGEEGEITFQKLRYKEQLPAELDIELRADVCYEYGTKSLVDMCLKKEPNKRRTNDICEITQESIPVDNSAAPVRVTNFAQRAGSSDKIKFTFDIEKTGSGDVFESGAFSDKCTTNNDKLDRINVDVRFIGSGASVSCNIEGSKNTGITKLISGKRTVRCEASGISQDIAFRKPLQIKLDYIFKDSVSKTFTIESSLF